MGGLIAPAQVSSHFPTYASPEALPFHLLSITTGFTTSLVFPYGISQVDVGSRDVLVRKSGAADNVLLLKAAKAGFSPTSLSVYTKEGRLYSYRLSYADTLSSYTYSYTQQEDWQSARPFLHQKAKSGGMEVRLEGIYSGEGKVWLVFQLRNRSPIDYFAGSVRFRIRDRKRSRKAVVQEENWETLQEASTLRIGAGQGEKQGYGFMARAPGKRKELLVEWADENGERRVQLVIPSKLLRKARQLP